MSVIRYTYMTLRGTTEELLEMLRVLRGYKENNRECQFDSLRISPGIDTETMEITQISTDDEIVDFFSRPKLKIEVDAEGPYGVGDVSESELFEKMAQAAPGAEFAGIIKSRDTGGQECYRGELKKGKLNLYSTVVDNADFPLLYVNAMKKIFSYEKFCKWFCINQDEFDENDFLEFVNEALIDDTFPVMDYDTFLKYCESSNIERKQYNKVISKVRRLPFTDYDDFEKSFLENKKNADYHKCYVVRKKKQ